MFVCSNCFELRDNDDTTHCENCNASVEKYRNHNMGGELFVVAAECVNCCCLSHPDDFSREGFVLGLKTIATNIVKTQKTMTETTNGVSLHFSSNNPARVVSVLSNS